MKRGEESPQKPEAHERFIYISLLLKADILADVTHLPSSEPSSSFHIQTCWDYD